MDSTKEKKRKEKIEGRQTNKFAEIIVIMLSVYKLAHFPHTRLIFLENYKWDLLKNIYINSKKN